MSPRIRLAAEEALATSALFLVSLYFYYVTIVSYHDHMAEGVLTDYLTSAAIHVEIWVGGVVLGVLVWGVNALAQRTGLRRRSFVLIVVVKTVLYTLAFAATQVVAHVALAATLLSPEGTVELMESTSPRVYAGVALWVLATILAINFLMEVRHKVGPGQLLALLTGHYQKPRMEERVFLFMDLAGSTGLAERLGPAEYSRFLRHCYHELTHVVVAHGAQIYQYVGDEVVLTWPGTSRAHRERCVRAYYDFTRRLTGQEEWFRRQFDAVPVFRGGIEVGAVAATEVGDVKREIAYHGDALNTAARLLEMGKHAGAGLLATESIREALAGARDFVAEVESSVRLRGQTHETVVYRVSPA